MANNGLIKSPSHQNQPNQNGTNHHPIQITTEPTPNSLNPLQNPGPNPLAPSQNLFTDIIVQGANQHNLKQVDVTIPRNRFVVITGVSGSGKSSLAFDTLYAEGQRRYVESLSSYARQFLGQMEKPQVDYIGGLSPAIAIEQKTVSKNPRSTVGTVTEIVDYLRVLYARTGTAHCPKCNDIVQPQSAAEIADQLASLPLGQRLQLLAPIIRNRKGTHRDRLKQAVGDGFTRARINGEIVELDGVVQPVLDKNKRHNIDLVVDRLIVPDKSEASVWEDFHIRLIDSVETTLRASEGLLVADLGTDGELLLSEQNACPRCDISFPELHPNLFSFNSPVGMCPDCNGLGTEPRPDPDLLVTNPELSLLDGASPYYGDLRKKDKRKWDVRRMESMIRHYRLNDTLSTPWKEMSAEFQNMWLYGTPAKKGYHAFEGVVNEINRRFQQTSSDSARRYYGAFFSKQSCPTCKGARLRAEANSVRINQLCFGDVTAMTIAQAHDWICSLTNYLTIDELEVATEVIKEIRDRLQFLLNVGLHYLTLDRPAPTLSGGEGQRIRLASQLGCGLVGVLYILDEPSIGLHSRDHHALLSTLTQLRDMGNTVLVVEHDADTMQTADWLIDLGPGAGVLGGEVVAAGTPQHVMADPKSLTGRYLTGSLQITAPNDQNRRPPQEWLTIQRARLHNLSNVTAQIPLGVFTCVTGVSGSGKSSLITKTLFPALARTLHNAQSVPGPHDQIEGLEQIDKIIHITQDPIGRMPRSNPATYVGVFTEIRKVFASVPDAKAQGYNAGRFSFNVKGGRCESCKGHGEKCVEMHFLADVWVTCKECGGQRFNRSTLDIAYKGKSIADVLNMDIREALDFFANHPKINRILQTLHDVGLDYIKLGQSALTLSGGEAQRVKLAKELSRVATGRTIYLLDEPTTGLHFADIQRLLDVLHRLVDKGNSVIVIEHNMDVIKTADWIIDLGPEGGEGGGSIVATIQESHTGRFLATALTTR
ncbi:excinuclease ABC subunit UvrA [Chloroflexi bacterium TSY]|nr:excinuclease ABC subunit UvrA [Chloroflexi bacterium TSY]